MKRVRQILALALLVLGAATPLVAHEARPIALLIEERGAMSYAVTLRVPASIEADNRPTLIWPADCTGQETGLVRCAQPLAGRSVQLHWPLYNPSVTTLARFTPQDGSTRTAVLPPEVTAWVIPAEPTRLAVIRSYFALGVSHILGGADHLLFVAGLLLVARGTRRVVLAVTGFTLGHSITLSLAALGVVRIPIAPTEAVIALSILFLAREALRPSVDSLVQRFPLLVSATFGLLHGLGFAAALGETGLPEREITWALLCFNLGVEAGQLSFIAAVLGVLQLARMLVQRVPLDIGRWRVAGRVFAAYLIGVPAAFWFLQRLA